MAPRPRILIGFGEALSAPEVAWSLLDAGFRVSVFAREGKRPPLTHSKSVDSIQIVPPEHDASGAVRSLEHYIGEHEFTAIMPLDDASVWVCDSLSERVSVPIVGPTGKHKDLALDKRLQLKLAAECGFWVPETTHILSIEQLFDLREFPLVLKPAMAVNLCNGRLKKGSNRICTNREDLDTFAKEWCDDMPFFAQPFIYGTGKGLFGIATMAGVENWSSHRRIRMMNPTGSGSSACSSIPVDETLKEPSAKMIESVGWKGLFMIELLCDEAGCAWFIELNGRPWGSMALARRQGFQYPAWAVQQVLDPDFQLPDVCYEGTVVCRHLGREIVHLLIVLHGPKTKYAAKWPSRWKTMREVLCFHRGDCWYNWRLGETALFVRDTLQTILGKVFSKRQVC